MAIVSSGKLSFYRYDLKYIYSVALKLTRLYNTTCNNNNMQTHFAVHRAYCFYYTASCQWPNGSSKS